MATQKTIKKPTQPKKAKAAGPAKSKNAAPRKKADGKLSCLAAAAKVLGETGQAMTTREMIEAMGAKSYWKSPDGLTPHATLYSAIAREIGTKGKDSRFTKTERGKFTAKKGG